MFINKDTTLFGSFSHNPGNNGTLYFNKRFQSDNINAIYKSYYVEDISDIFKVTKILRFGGFAVSSPFKISAMQYVDYYGDKSEMIGSINTVTINQNGDFIGYNTDFMGLSDMFKLYEWYSLSDVKIIGDGGLSKSLQYLFNINSISYDILSRVDTKNLKSYEQCTIFNCSQLNLDKLTHNLFDFNTYSKIGMKLFQLQADYQYKIYTNECF